MNVYLHSDGSEKQSGPSLGSGPGPGRRHFLKYFLGLVVMALMLSPSSLFAYSPPSSPFIALTGSIADSRAAQLAAVISALSSPRRFLSAQSAASAERESKALTIEAPVSYFNGLLVVFGFVIGVWLTVLMMIVISWRLKLGRQDAAKDAAQNAAAFQALKQGQSGALGSENQSLDEQQLMLKITTLREILKGMADRVETLDLADPREATAKSAALQEELEDLILEADSVVNNMADELTETAQNEFFRDPSAKVEVREDLDNESPEHAEMHIRARNLRAEGCRLLAEDKTKEAMCCFEESLSILQTLSQASPENQLWRRDQVLAYHNMGRTMESLGLNQEALDYFNEALTQTRKLVNQNPGSLDWKRGLAASHSHMGRILAAMGNLDEAWRNFDKEIDTLSFMVNKQPENKSWQYALASAYHNMGQLLERRGQNREALDVFKKDQAVLKKLVDSDPNNTVWLYDLACVNGQMARMYKEQGRFKDALGNARRYLGAMRKLSEREPNNTTYRRELTVALGQVGRLLELRGEYDQARTTFKATLEIRRNLVEMDPSNPTWQDDLLVCLYKMGDVYFAQKEYEGAWQYYQEALELVESLIDKDGQEDNWLMGKCGVLLRLGNLHQVHDASTAANYYRSALNIAEQQHDDNDKQGDWRELAGLIKKNMAHQERVTH